MSDYAITVRHMAMYTCRSCGYQCAYPSRFIRCPVCRIKWS